MQTDRHTCVPEMWKRYDFSESGGCLAVQGLSTEQLRQIMSENTFFQDVWTVRFPEEDVGNRRGQELRVLHVIIGCTDVARPHGGWSRMEERETNTKTDGIIATEQMRHIFKTQSSSDAKMWKLHYERSIKDDCVSVPHGSFVQFHNHAATHSHPELPPNCGDESSDPDSTHPE